MIAALLASTLGCSSEVVGEADASVDTGSLTDSPAAPDATFPPGGDPSFIARCEYTNPFSMQPECREYRGAGWSPAAAAADCTRVFLSRAGELTLGSACALPNSIGRCVVGDLSALGYTTFFSGAASACGAAQTACQTFARGTFWPETRCAGCEATGEMSSNAFVPPTVDCRPARTGEAPGRTDGRVCTPTLISGSTEEGRRFADYASCDVVRTQRPYYAAPPARTPSASDPRLADEAYLREVAWVRSQAEASACACCHSSSRTPRGASIWDTEAGPLWTDTLSDNALAMIGGFTDSRAFGFYPAAANNGFDRSSTGLPTTDVARLRTFVQAELERRGVTAEAARALPPFAPFFREIIEYEPSPCESGIGIDEGGRLRWSGGPARYLSVLAEGSASPGVPPNYDLPEGTLWAIAVPPTQPAMGCGLEYGVLPETAFQRVPAAGDPPALTSGQRYYLYVQRDVLQPITRCTFVAP